MVVVLVDAHCPSILACCLDCHFLVIQVERRTLGASVRVKSGFLSPKHYVLSLRAELSCFLQHHIRFEWKKEDYSWSSLLPP